MPARAERSVQKKSSCVSTRERKKDHTSFRTRTFCRATNTKIVQNGKKGAERVASRPSLFWVCVLCLFPPFRAPRAEILRSLSRDVSQAFGKFESEIPRHDHDITRPFVLEKERKKEEGSLLRRAKKTTPRVRETTFLQQKGLKTRAKSSSSTPTVMALRDSKIPLMNFETNFADATTKIERRRKEEEEESFRDDAPALPSFCATNIPSCWLFLCHWSTFARFSMASSAASSKRKRQYACGSIDDCGDPLDDTAMSLRCVQSPTHTRRLSFALLFFLLLFLSGVSKL